MSMTKRSQIWYNTSLVDAEAETPVLWPPHAKSWLIRKDPDAGRDWGQEEKGTTEDEMAGWHHRLDGHGFQKTPGVGDGQGSLACCDSWGRKESDMTEWLNWTELKLSWWPKRDVINFISLNSDKTLSWYEEWIHQLVVIKYFDGKIIPICSFIQLSYMLTHIIS